MTRVSLFRFLPAALLLIVSGLVVSCDQGSVPTEPETSEPQSAKAPSSAAVQSTPSAEAIPNRYIVAFSDQAGAPAEAAQQLSRQFGVQNVLYVYQHAFRGFAGKMPEQAAQKLSQSPLVEYVEQDQKVQAIAQTLPAGIDRIEIDQNSTANIDGVDDAMDVDIGIIDTGIDLDHDDLDAVDAINCIDSGASADDDNGHGTHVAGSAAAIDNGTHVVGAAPGARVHAVKVLDSGGSGTISSVVCGIDYVTNNASTFEVANMSLGAQGTSSTMRTAIQNSVDAGIYYAVAAGNDASDVYGSDGTFGTSDDFIPAAYPEVATVSAMADFDGTDGGDGGTQLFIGCGQVEDDTFAECFSNYSGSLVSDDDNPDNTTGAAIDLAAPGVAVLSTTNDGGTGEKSGTSMSSPHVAGTAALYIVEKGLSPSSASDVKAIREDLIAAGQDQSNWQSGDTKDPDSNPEPLVMATFGSTDSPPSVSWLNPSDGETVNGTVTIKIDASDDNDSGSDLTVEWQVDDGTWQTATYDSGCDCYTDSWDTSNVSDGDHNLDARATDTAGNTSSEARITVTVDNTDNAPSVSWINPKDGDTVSGTVTIKIDASDDRDSGSDLTVEWQVDDGTWNTASYDSGCDCYTDSWDTSNVSDGDHNLDARATDTSGNTSSEARITVTADNSTDVNMHVGDLDGNSINNGSTWTAEVTATVHDPNHDPLADATVNFSYDGRDVSGTVSCTTASDGQCTVSVSDIPKRTGDVTFTVEDVSHSDFTYDANDNHDPDGDSDGTTITVQKP